MVISQRASSPVSHGLGTSAPSRAYAPTSASICGMLFLPNSTRRVPSVCRTRADPRLTDRLTSGEVPCRLTARASPFASHGPRLAGDGAHRTGALAK